MAQAKMLFKSGGKVEQFPAPDSFEKIFSPQLQVEKTKQALSEVLKCAQDDLGSVTNRKAKTLLETTIALAQGLIKAFEHYENFWKQREKRNLFKTLN